MKRKHLCAVNSFYDSRRFTAGSHVCSLACYHKHAVTFCGATVAQNTWRQHINDKHVDTVYHAAAFVSAVERLAASRAATGLVAKSRHLIECPLCLAAPDMPDARTPAATTHSQAGSAWLGQHLVHAHHDVMQLGAGVVHKLVQQAEGSDRCPLVDLCGRSCSGNGLTNLQSHAHFLTEHVEECLLITRCLLAHCSVARPCGAHSGGLYTCPFPSCSFTTAPRGDAAPSSLNDPGGTHHTPDSHPHFHGAMPWFRLPTHALQCHMGSILAYLTRARLSPSTTAAAASALAGVTTKPHTISGGPRGSSAGGALCSTFSHATSHHHYGQPMATNIPVPGILCGSAGDTAPMPSLPSSQPSFENHHVATHPHSACPPLHQPVPPFREAGGRPRADSDVAVTAVISVGGADWALSGAGTTLSSSKAGGGPLTLPAQSNAPQKVTTPPTPKQDAARSASHPRGSTAAQGATKHTGYAAKSKLQRHTVQRSPAQATTEHTSRPSTDCSTVLSGSPPVIRKSAPGELGAPTMADSSPSMPTPPALEAKKAGKAPNPKPRRLDWDPVATSTDTHEPGACTASRITPLCLLPMLRHDNEEVSTSSLMATISPEVKTSKGGVIPAAPRPFSSSLTHTVPHTLPAPCAPPPTFAVPVPAVLHPPPPRHSTPRLSVVTQMTNMADASLLLNPTRTTHQQHTGAIQTPPLVGGIPPPEAEAAVYISSTPRPVFSPLWTTEVASHTPAATRGFYGTDGDASRRAWRHAQELSPKRVVHTSHAAAPPMGVERGAYVGRRQHRGANVSSPAMGINRAASKSRPRPNTAALAFHNMVLEGIPTLDAMESTEPDSTTSCDGVGETPCNGECPGGDSGSRGGVNAHAADDELIAACVSLLELLDLIEHMQAPPTAAAAAPLQAAPQPASGKSSDARPSCDGDSTRNSARNGLQEAGGSRSESPGDPSNSGPGPASGVNDIGGLWDQVAMGGVAPRPRGQGHMQANASLGRAASSPAPQSLHLTYVRARPSAGRSSATHKASPLQDAAGDAAPPNGSPRDSSQADVLHGSREVQCRHPAVPLPFFSVQHLGLANLLDAAATVTAKAAATAGAAAKVLTTLQTPPHSGAAPRFEAEAGSAERDSTTHSGEVLVSGAEGGPGQLSALQPLGAVSASHLAIDSQQTGVVCPPGNSDQETAGTSCAWERGGEGEHRELPVPATTASNAIGPLGPRTPMKQAPTQFADSQKRYQRPPQSRTLDPACSSSVDGSNGEASAGLALSGDTPAVGLVIKPATEDAFRECTQPLVIAQVQKNACADHVRRVAEETISLTTPSLCQIRCNVSWEDAEMLQVEAAMAWASAQLAMSAAQDLGWNTSQGKPTLAAASITGAPI